VVDSFPEGCRMRTTSEGQATDAAAARGSNCLKVLKKMVSRFLQKAVDKVAVQCRMRASFEAVSRTVFGGFERV
ncbi:hypothetical protein ACQUTG_18385, partial [Marinobacter sp. DUT-1]